MPKQTEENILMIVAYPELQQSDYQKIQTIRQQYDPNSYAFIKPHFTLLAPCKPDNKEAIQYAISNNLKQQKSFNFSLTKAVASPPKGYHTKWYLFLIPEQGAIELEQLHQAIHQGELQALQQQALPFTPHMTIGVFKEEAECKAAAEQLNQQLLQQAINGTVNSIDFITTKKEKALTAHRKEFKHG
jgi:2'-5' RNA ligase